MYGFMRKRKSLTMQLDSCIYMASKSQKTSNWWNKW